MKRVIFTCLLLFLTLQGVTAFARTLPDPVRKKTQVPKLAIPDSLDIVTTFSRSLTRGENIKQFNKLIGVYLVFAIDTLKSGRTEEAERMMMDDVLPLLSHYGDGYNMYHSFMTLGKSYHAQKKYSQAKWFFIQANTIAKKIVYRSGDLYSLIELARVKEAIKDNSLALADYRKAAELAKRLKFTTTLASVNKNINRLAAAEKTAALAADTQVAQTLKN